MGKCVLARHRGSRYGIFFKYLNHLSKGDEVKLTDKEGNSYSYLVEGSYVADPYDNSVKDQRGEKELTLLTCENSGTMRLIVKCTAKKERNFGRMKDEIHLDKLP
ncbi:sortase [Lachnospiraceae bacterium ZAX-1]